MKQVGSHLMRFCGGQNIKVSLLVFAVTAFLLLSCGKASRVLSQDGPGGGVPIMMRGEAREVETEPFEPAEDEPTEDAAGNSGAGESPAVQEETRKLSPFKYVTSCVPLNVLVLGTRVEDLDGEAPERTAVNGESVKRGAADDDDDGPFSVWIEAEADVISGLKTEVINDTLHVDFVDADFSSTNPIKVIVNAPENALKGVHNSGVISTMVVLGFSPDGDFNITNTSPFGALIVDDLKADGGSGAVNIASFGNGFTAVIGGLDRLFVKSTGGTGDILIDGAAKSLNVDLQGTGNILVDGTEHLLITGDVGSPTSGVIAYTRGGCTVTTRFEDDGENAEGGMIEAEEEEVEYDDEDDEGEDEGEGDEEGEEDEEDEEEMMSQMMPGMDMDDDIGMGMPDMMVHGCVKLPEEAEPSMFGVPDVEEYMTWTCGLMVKGTFNCLRGVASRDVPALDCGRRNVMRPECREVRRGSRVQGRAAHGINAGSQCEAGTDPMELMMSSAVEGMEDIAPSDAAAIVDDPPVNRPVSAETRPMEPGASVQSAFGVVEGVN